MQSKFSKQMKTFVKRRSFSYLDLLRKILRKKKAEKKGENKSNRDRKSGRSLRAFSPPLPYPQMNLSCCLIMFLSFSPRGSQANFLHSASTWLIGWYLGWPAVVYSKATGSFSSCAGSCSCFILTYTTLHSCTHTFCVSADKHACCTNLSDCVCACRMCMCVYAYMCMAFSLKHHWML